MNNNIKVLTIIMMQENNLVATPMKQYVIYAENCYIRHSSARKDELG